MSRAPKVLVLNHFAVPRGEPGGTRHVEMFGRLRGWRHLIVASRLNLTTGRPQAAQPGFMPVWVMPYKGNGVTRILNWCSYVWSSLAAGLGLRKAPPDVVYASSPHLLAGASGYVLSRLYGRPFILEVRDLWPRILVDMGAMSRESRIYRALTQLEHFLYRRADAIVTMASGTGSYLEELGIEARKIRYIPNGADPSDFLPSADRDELRKRYGFSRFTAVYTGAHGPANGLDGLLTAAASMQGSPVDIVLVGDGAEKGRLQNMAQEQGLRNVRFMDPMPKSEIPDLLHAADVGLHILAEVSLFRSAVSPNKVFDYMAAGLPVVTNSRGVVESWVTESGSGWCVDITQLSDRLQELSDYDGPELTDHGRRGRAWIQANQSRSAMTRRLEGLLNEVLEHSSAAVEASDSPGSSKNHDNPRGLQ